MRVLDVDLDAMVLDAVRNEWDTVDAVDTWVAGQLAPAPHPGDVLRTVSMLLERRSLEWTPERRLRVVSIA